MISEAFVAFGRIQVRRAVESCSQCVCVVCSRACVCRTCVCVCVPHVRVCVSVCVCV